jgi:malonyl-CoA O-methyltransferase
MAKTVADWAGEAAPHARRILDVGCGTGLLTRRIRTAFPQASLSAIDHAPAMVAQARAHEASPDIQFEAADLMTWDAAAGSFDLIVSTAALHWIPQPLQALHRLHQLLSTNGTLLIGVMLCETFSELQQVRAEVTPHKIPPTLPSFDEWPNWMDTAGFEMLDSKTENHVHYYPTTSAFFQSLQKMGTTGGAYAEPSIQLNRSELSELKKEYTRQFEMPDEGVPARYSMGFYYARKS